MIQVRFGLCPNLDADLIQEIEEIANGGSWNEAARFYLRFLHRQSKGQNVTPERQNNVTERADSDNGIGELEINLSSLDIEFGE